MKQITPKLALELQIVAETFGRAQAERMLKEALERAAKKNNNTKKGNK